MNNEYIQMNKLAWEEAFDVSGGYGKDNSARLKAEKTPFLDTPMVEALRAMPLAGKEIGHFCCNNGREMMNAILLTGAKGGVGFDIAENILAQARRTAREAGIDCEFVQGNVLETAAGYTDRFDCLLVTIGALCWMEELDDFFRLASAALRPGGRLLIYEIHPASDMLATPEEKDYYVPEDPKKLVYSYFSREPFLENDGMGYMAGKQYESKTFVSFRHTMGEIVTSVAGAGLTIESLAEYDVDTGGNFPNLTGKGFPLSFQMIARKG